MDSYTSASRLTAHDDAAEPFVAPAPELPVYDERRPDLKLRPAKAWHHFRELLKDKENTEEVFHIFEALPWKGLRASAEAFLATPFAQQLRVSEPYLPAILDDHAALRKLPAGSVAHAYCDFMEREGLTGQGLVDEFDKFLGDRPRFTDQVDWYLNRMRDTHDLLHILTGYGRDALGEQCVLAFTYSQQPSLAHLFIGYAGGLNIKQTVKTRAPVLRAIREGQRLGKSSPRIAQLSIRELLATPLDAARAKLGITPARYYAQAHDLWRAEGIDPYDLLVAKAA